MRSIRTVSLALCGLLALAPAGNAETEVSVVPPPNPWLAIGAGLGGWILTGGPLPTGPLGLVAGYSYAGETEKGLRIGLTGTNSSAISLVGTTTLIYAVQQWDACTSTDPRAKSRAGDLLLPFLFGVIAGEVVSLGYCLWGLTDIFQTALAKGKSSK